MKVDFDTKITIFNDNYFPKAVHISSKLNEEWLLYYVLSENITYSTLITHEIGDFKYWAVFVTKGISNIHEIAKSINIHPPKWQINLAVSIENIEKEIEELIKQL